MVKEGGNDKNEEKEQDDNGQGGPKKIQSHNGEKKGNTQCNKNGRVF